MSGTPLPSTSPMPATAAPKSSPVISSGPLVENRVMPDTLSMPSRFMNMINTPPPPNTPGLPTPTSGMPSRSKSPMPATASPNLPLAGTAMSGSLPAIATARSAVPSGFISTRCTEPAPSSGMPTAKSGTPSRSKSPMPPAAVPSIAADAGRSGADSLSATETETDVPDMSSTCTSPASLLAPGDPTARSVRPSPFMSADATDHPKSEPDTEPGTSDEPFSVASEFM